MIESLVDKFGPSSGKPFDVALGQLGWTDDDLCFFKQERFKILDIGAGFSGLVPGLLEAGIDAYAVDPKYERPNKVFTDEIKSAKKTLYGGIEYLLDPSHRVTSDYLLEIYQDAFKQFKLARARYPDRFKTASFGALPFADNVFARVVSMEAVAAYANKSENDFYKGMLDVARVTKSGGVVAMSPWYINIGLTRDIAARKIIMPKDSDAYDAKLRELSEELPEAGELLRRRMVARRLFREGRVSSISRNPPNGSLLNENIGLLVVS